jgi:hypothetical protein
MDRSYENSVFINCPFDRAYRPLFEAVVFAAYDCGFYSRSGRAGARQLPAIGDSPRSKTPA